MSKQLKFNKKEQDQILKALSLIGGILFKKIGAGVTAPCLSVELITLEGDLSMTGELTATKKEVVNG